MIAMPKHGLQVEKEDHMVQVEQAEEMPVHMILIKLVQEVLEVLVKEAQHVNLVKVLHQNVIMV
jgi:hypothetical protein